MRTRSIPHLTFLLTILTFAAIVIPSGALTVDIHPNSVCPGDMVSIDITGLADGSAFNHTLTSTNLVSTGLHWYNLTSFHYPFNISSGRVHVEGHNVDRIKIETKLAGVTTSIESTGSGTVTLDFFKEINATVFDYYLINYDVTNTALPVTITWIHNGTKTGPDDSTTTFHVDGASAGDIRCLISVNGAVVDDEVVSISACPTPTTPTPGGQTGGSSNDFPLGFPTATATVTATPTPTPTPTVTGGTEITDGDGSGSGNGEEWRWEFIPPIVLTWLGQDTAGQYEPQLISEGGNFPWGVRRGIIVLIVAVIAIIYMRMREE